MNRYGGYYGEVLDGEFEDIFEKKLEEDFDKLVKAFSKVAKKNN